MLFTTNEISKMLSYVKTSRNSVPHVYGTCYEEGPGKIGLVLDCLGNFQEIHNHITKLFSHLAVIEGPAVN